MKVGITTAKKYLNAPYKIKWSICLAFPNAQPIQGYYKKKENFTYFVKAIFNFYHVTYNWHKKFSITLPAWLNIKKYN